MKTTRRAFLRTAAVGVSATAVATSLLRAGDSAGSPAPNSSPVGRPPAADEIVDWHAHFLPPRFVDALRARAQPPHIVRTSDGREVRVSERESPGQPLREALVSVDARLRANDAMGVTRQVLSLAGLGADGLPAAEAAALAEEFNRGLSEIVAAHPQRFSGLAALPLQDPNDAARVLERGVTQFGLLGAILPVDAFLTLPSARLLLPVFEAANRLHAHLFIHPGTWPHSSANPRGAEDVPYRSSVIDLQGRVASAFATLALSDLLAPYPDLTVQVANLGGAIPFYVDRFRNVAHERGANDPISAFRRFFVDTGSQGSRSLELAATVLGPDRILFGTDAPGFSPPDILAAVRAAQLSPNHRQRILSGNGTAILRRRAQPHVG
jgi:predicted TIM-barrel fold metal-dependent hydrolase